MPDLPFGNSLCYYEKVQMSEVGIRTKGERCETVGLKGDRVDDREYLGIDFMNAKKPCQSFGSFIFRIASCLALSLGMVFGQDAVEGAVESSYTIMKITDLDKTVTFTVLTPEDLKTLTATVNAEQKALDRAYNNLVANWKAKHMPKTPDPTGKRPKIPAYPLKRPEPKKITYIARFTTEAEALAKKKECEAKEAARLEEVQKREEKANRQDSGAMSGSSSVFSNPNAPMAKAAGNEEIDPDLRTELFAQLKKEIDAVVAGDAGISINGAQSKGGKTSKVRQVKRMGEGSTTPLDKSPGQMARPAKPSK
jgi:hypothetical protein